MDKAGAYGIQGKFAAYIKEIHGDYNNVVGLPVGRLYQELKTLGVLEEVMEDLEDWQREGVRDLEKGGDVQGYLFRCLCCGKHLLQIDYD